MDWSLNYLSNASEQTKLDPPGYIPNQPTRNHHKSRRNEVVESAHDSALKSMELSALKHNKAWETAISPGKALFTTAFMMYMSGSGIQIFSISIVFMTIWGALKGFTRVNSVFEPFQISNSKTPTSEELDFTPQKIAYIGCQILALGLGLYKADTMGLLPSRASDWIEFWQADPLTKFSPGTTPPLY